MRSPYDPELAAIVARSLARISAEARESSPVLAGHIASWLADLAGDRTPQEYFTHPSSFPMLQVPWWVEETLQTPPDFSFQENLVFSTLSGYCYVRLLDNLMDGHHTVERGLLPALGVFHTNFQLPYQRYFPAGHRFWKVFAGSWFGAAEVTLIDSHLAEIDHAQFIEVSARKTGAARIPVAAVCHRYDRPGLFEGWSTFLDRFSCWHQMWNDLFDWPRDQRNGTVTYFLSEAERRRQAGESVAEWVAREGFEWGIEALDQWMSEARSAATALDCPTLIDYLRSREEMVREQTEVVERGLESAAQLAGVLRVRA